MAVLAAGIAAVALASTAGAHDCQCRYFGQSYDQGTTVCMRGKIARCGMYLNNSSWNIIADECPLAGSPKPPLQSPSPQRLAALPGGGAR